MDYLPALFLVAAILFLLSEIRSLILGISSKDWRSVKGTVLKAQITERNDSEYGSVRYDVDVHYLYKISGTTYESSVHSYSKLSGNHADAIQALRGVIAGRDITVYYDPKNPSRSVLVNGQSSGNYISIAICLFFIAMIIQHM